MGKANPPVTGPWMAEVFAKAHRALADLDNAGRFSDFTISVLSDEQLEEFISRFMDVAGTSDEDEYMPLELQVLSDALWKVIDLLEYEAGLRNGYPEHRQFCAEAHAQKFGKGGHQ